MTKNVALVAAAALAALAVGCSSKAAPKPAAREAETPKVADLDRPLDEIFSAATKCEHGIPQYTCAECRYQLGVVRIDPALVASGEIGTARLAPRPIAAARETTGVVRLDENRSAYIGPRAPGIVRAVRADLGDHVRAGEVLFEVETTDLGESRAAHAKAHAALDLARATLRREEELFAKRICPEKEVQEARAAVAQAEADAQAAHQRLLALGVTEADLEARDDRTQGGRSAPVRAPFAGVVLERSLSVGALVSPGEKNLLLGDTSTVWVDATLHESDLAALLERRERGGAPVEVLVGAYPGRVFAGRIAALGGVLDEATRTASARVVVENGEGLLRPGMFAAVRLPAAGGAATLAAPAEALLEDEGRTFVFVRHDREYFVRRPVKPGRRGGGFVEILSGAAAGDEVVARAAFLLKSDVLRSKMGAGCAD